MLARLRYVHVERKTDRARVDVWASWGAAVLRPYIFYGAGGGSADAERGASRDS